MRSTFERDVFGATARPGALYDLLTAHGTNATIGASALLRALLDGLGSIWLTGSTLDGRPLGDAWRHPHAGGDGTDRGVGAVPQALAVARLLAVRAVRMGGRDGRPAATT